MKRAGNSLIWDYFERKQESKIAECNICNKNISYKTTITNLKQHLKLKHVNALTEFLSRSLSHTYKRALKPETSPETNYSSEQEIEYLEEPVQNHYGDVYVISRSTTSTPFNIESEHLIQTDAAQSQQNRYHSEEIPIRNKIKRNKVAKSVEALRRIYFMKKCSNLLLERKKLMNEIANQRREHDLKMKILQKTLSNLNKI